MSDTPNFDFSKFVPGFDFLQNLTKGATQKMPKLGGWVAPTINPEELDKRIEELKAVQFWLDQNAAALKATIQALEVQKMTLATLRGMNFSMGEPAEAFKIKTPAPTPKAAEPAPAPAPAPAPEKAPEPSPPPAAAAPAETPADADSGDTGGTAKPEAAASGVVDPLQWWNALTTQFQQIAASAIKDAASKTAEDSSKAAKFAESAFKSAGAFAKVAAKPLVPAKSSGSASTGGKRPAAGAAAKKAAAKPAGKNTKPAAAKKRAR